MSAVLAPTPVRLPPPQLTVDLGAVAANVRAIDRVIAGELMAVVKADGFGHGAVDVARTALSNGATRLGVATIGEALALRTAGIGAPVLSWLNAVDADFESAVRAGVEVAVSGIPQLGAVAATSRTARVHLHVDTGMARDGAPSAEWPALVAAARQAELRGAIEVVGIMGHLPCADQPGHPSTVAGRSLFLSAVAAARRAGLRPRFRHLGATAAALNEPSTHFDLCRIGAGLYGIGPGLTEALTLTAPVVSVRDVPAGTPVGYGHTWVSDRATRLVQVPLGYGDGIPRAASGSAEVLVHGRRRPLVGLVSMDQFVVDVGDSRVEVGDEVTVVGRGGPSVAEWAAWAGTIPHEVMTGLGARVR